MSAERPYRRAPWPGLDGWLLLLLGATSVVVWWLRGQLGGEQRLLVVGVIDTLWLLGTGLLRRWGRVRLPPGATGFAPVVVIPTHDNGDTAVQVALRARERCDHVIVVDDGSADGRPLDALRQVEGVRLLRHERNRGKGAALHTAFVAAWESGFSHAITLDADGQHDPADIDAFIDAARREPGAIHLGVRDLSGAPGSSQFGRRFSNFWVWAETGHRVGDSQSGFRAYPLRAVLSLGLAPGRYEWEVEVLVRGIWARLGVRDLPCRVHYPPEEERVSSFRPWLDNTRISLLNTRLFLSRLVWPARWFNPVDAPETEWRGRHLGRVWGWAFFLGVLRLFGRRATHLAMGPMALFYLVFAGPHRRGLRAYLSHAHQAGVPIRDDLWTALRVFYQFACSLIDRFWLLVRGPGAFVMVHEHTAPAKALLTERGAIFLTTHLGNPDLGATALQGQEYQRPVNILQYTDGEDPYIVLLRRHLDDQQVPNIISLNEGEAVASIEAVRALRRGEIVAIKGDRIVDDRVATVTIFGEELRLPTGPFLLAAISGAPLFLLGCFAEGGDRYRVISTDPWELRFSSRARRDEDLQRWAQRFADQIEAWARRYPLQWYNFYDLWR